jgi:hypothetical protein
VFPPPAGGKGPSEETAGVKREALIPELNPIRHPARPIPAPLDGVAELWAALLSDIADLPNGLPGNGLDTWDPEYIERTLPLLHMTFGTYFRDEVRGRENIPSKGPRCSWATTPAA